MPSRMVADVRCGLAVQCGGDEQPGRPGSAPGACPARDQEPDAEAGNQGARSCPSSNPAGALLMPEQSYMTGSLSCFTDALDTHLS